MPRLNIEGVKINIGDDFLKLSPQEQNDFVQNTIVPSAEFKAAQGARPAIKAEEAPAPEAQGVISEFKKAINPLEAAREIGRTASEGLAKVEALRGRGGQGTLEGWGTTAQGLMGAGEVIASPVIGAARSYGGHLLTAAELAAGKAIKAGGRLFGKELVGEEDPARMYETARGDIDLAAMAARPFGAPRRLPNLPGGSRVGPYETPGYGWEHPPPPIPRVIIDTPAPPALSPLQEMAQRANVTLPRALTGTPLQQQAAQALARQTAVGGGQIGEAIAAVPEQLATRRGEVAGELGAERLPENVGADIRSTLTGQAEAEAAQAKTQAQIAYENTKRGWEQSNAQRDQQIQQAETQSAGETAQAVGPTPAPMGEHGITAVRAAHDTAQRRKNALYDEATTHQGIIHDPAVTQLHGSVAAELRREGQRGRVALGPDTTPRAMEMNAAVRDFTVWAERRMEAAQYDNRPTGATLEQFDDFRKDLNAIYANVEKPADIRAANRIMKGVDDWAERAMGSQHYVGSPEALPARLRARAANRDLMERFGYNDRFPEDKIIQKIVKDGPTDHIGPNELDRLLSLAPDKAGRVLDRLFEATGNDPQLRQSIRGDLLQRAMEPVRDGVPRTPRQIADDVARLTLGKKEGLASRLYSPQEIGLMRRHAQVLRTAERARDQAATIARTTEPKPTRVEPGAMENLVKDVIGNRSDEAIVRSIKGMATGKGSPQDIRNLAEVLKALPEDLKKNFLNLFIREMGNGPDNAFSPKYFADAWQKHISPQVKTLLTGGSAEHARKLDDLAGIARAYDDVHRKFGNPSGSGHTINFVKSLTTAASLMASGTVLGPAATLAGWLGTAGYARFLARPAGAASAARFARQMKKFQDTPTVAQAAATRLAARNMRNTAVGLGISVAAFPEPAKK